MWSHVIFQCNSSLYWYGIIRKLKPYFWMENPLWMFLHMASNPNYFNDQHHVQEIMKKIAIHTLFNQIRLSPATTYPKKDTENLSFNRFSVSFSRVNQYNRNSIYF